MSHEARPTARPLALANAPTDWAGVVDRVVEGDREAFLVLARLVTGCLAHWRAFDFRDDWDDVVQEVVIAVVEAWRAGRIEHAEALPGYVRQATRFKFIDRLRRQQREAPDIDPEDAALAMARLPDPRELSQRGLSQEARLSLWRAIDDLPEKQRIAVVEVYARGNSYAEAERASGIPLGSLKRHLRDGLSALRAALGDDA